MAIPPDPHYIPAFSIEDVLLDKDTGAPLTGGIVTFFEDDQRLVLKPVFQITGTSPNYTFIQLPNPMTLSAIGTFEDSLGNPVIPYFFPYDAALNVQLYYITVTSSGLVPQFTREAQPYIPNTGGGTVVPGTVTNEISNPQFAEVLFDTIAASYTFNFNTVTSHEVEIAPDWSIIVTSPGVGSVTVTQLTPVGSLNLPTNPGTLLQINSTGLTSLLLRQRITGSPNLWGNGYISAGFMAKVYGGTSKTLTLEYSQSNGAITNQTLVTATLPASGDYAYYSASKFIDMSTSSDDFPNAYVDIFFDIPLSVMVDITSVMAVATGSTSVANIGYDQESNPRQIDHLFHYYKPELAFKLIPSLLVGWDFPLNPAQEFGTSVTITTTAGYIWDQTIGQCVVNTVSAARDSVTGGFQVTTSDPTQAFYIMQYLSDGQAKEILGTRLAVNLNAFRTTAGGAVTVRVYLFRGSSSAVFPTLPLTIGGATPLASSGVFTLNSTAGQGQNWSLIARGELGQAYGTLPVVDTADWETLNDAEDLQFIGWELTDTTQISNTDKFCMVVTFQCPTTGTIATIDSCSLVKGDIPTRPGAQSADEVLRECQYYYENTLTYGGAKYAMQQAVAFPSTPAANVYTTSFYIQFETMKRVAPSLLLFNGFTGAANTFDVAIYYATVANQVSTTGPNAINVNFWTAISRLAGISFEPTLTASAAPLVTVAGGGTVSGTSFYATGVVAMLYKADARLGII